MTGTLKLTDRLRGIYVLPVNDGAGPLDGKDTFTREFTTPPIQHEAADVIENMIAALKMAVQLAARVADSRIDEVRIDGDLMAAAVLQEIFESAVEAAR